MWRRLYLALVLVRLYFALSPSYLHPDENFQGPEVIAGRIFNYPVPRTWEFTSSRPLRSVFPLWPVYGLPMLLLRWVWGNGENQGEVAPEVVFWTLRVLMFILSFVLEDWAIHELVPSPRHRRLAMLLVSSSYVTWTFQTHTFSNSVETLLVAWSLVLIRRILEDGKQRSSIIPSAMFGFLVALGVFNRITFPAFIFIPSLRLLPHFWSRPLSLLAAGLCAGLSVLLGVYLDTIFYHPESHSLSTLARHAVFTPLNNLRYNANPQNLAQHGLHPYYQHLVANLPLLLGPAYLLIFCVRRLSINFVSAVSGVFLLSLVRHQEARFLVPAVPLFLASVRPPRQFFRAWVALWIAFNVFMGIFMGIYHQGGIIPTQNFLAGQDRIAEVLWWRTYSPPTWLLDGKIEQIKTTVLMGMPPERMVQELARVTTCHLSTSIHANDTFLVAPESSAYLDPLTGDSEYGGLRLQRVWHYPRHLNLDDLDIAREGVRGTLKRVVGRRGLTTWRVSRQCA